MYKAISAFCIIVTAAICGCYKPDALLYQDQSTAVMADKSKWTVTADSETPDGYENTGKASALLDGNINTYWHTDYSVTPVPGFPHWVLIDMKTPNHLITVAVTNRQAATPNKVGMKHFRLEGSADGTTFTSLGEFDFQITNDAQKFPVSSKTAFRYLKLTALTSQTGVPHTFLAEIDVFVTKE